MARAVKKKPVVKRKKSASAKQTGLAAGKVKRSVSKTKKKAAKKSAPKKTAVTRTKAAAKKTTPKPVPAKKAKKQVVKKVTVEKKTAKKAPARQAMSPEAQKAARSARAAKSRKTKRFRKMLIERYDDLLRAYNSSKGNTRTAASDGTEDYIDYAVSSYDRDFSLSLTEMERGQIRLVEEALKRIDRRQFGPCLQCGQEIPEKRLEVEPWARHCIRCQELEEQGLLEASDFDRDDEEDGDEARPAKEDEDDEFEASPGTAEEEPQEKAEASGGSDDEEEELTV